MRRSVLWTAVAGCIASILSGASTASAFAIPWQGTLTLDLGRLGKAETQTGTGVADLDFDAGRISTLKIRLLDGLTLDQAVPVTDPAVVGTVASARLESVAPNSGTVIGIDAIDPVFDSRLALAGLARFCFVAGCATSFPIDLLPTPGLGAGIGIGGLLTAAPASGLTQISAQAAPWQLAEGTAVQFPHGGVSKVQASEGFVHGPLSHTGFAHTTMSGSMVTTSPSTFATAGVIQLISPTQIDVTGPSGNTDRIALFSSLTLRFVPEPSALLMLCSGVIGLALLGRSRIR